MAGKDFSFHFHFIWHQVYRQHCINKCFNSNTNYQGRGGGRKNKKAYQQLKKCIKCKFFITSMILWFIKSSPATSAHMTEISACDTSIPTGHGKHTWQCKLSISIPICSININLRISLSGKAKELPNPEVDPRQEMTIAICNLCHCPVGELGITTEAELSRLDLAGPRSHQLSCSLLVVLVSMSSTQQLCPQSGNWHWKHLGLTHSSGVTASPFSLFLPRHTKTSSNSGDKITGVAKNHSSPLLYAAVISNPGSAWWGKNLLQEGSEKHTGGTSKRHRCISCGAMHSCNPHQKQTPGSSDFCLHILTDSLIYPSLSWTRFL